MKRFMICESVETTTWDQVPPTDIHYKASLASEDTDVKLKIEWVSDGAPSFLVVGQTYHLELERD